MLMPGSPPRVAVIGAGGTMSSLGATSLDLVDYPDYGRKLSVAEVIERVPEASLMADIIPVPFASVGSPSMTAETWFELRAMIRRLAKDIPDLAGVVVIHGTATLEETAFFLNLTLDVPQTVVLVGAQRPLSAVSSDAQMNLVNALKVAADPSSRDRGVLVVMNDEIHSGRDVTKTATLRLQTFRSVDFGALGVVDADGVRFYRRADRPHSPDTAFASLADDVKLPRVDIVYSYAGADGVPVRAFIEAGARGIISAGLAPGMPATGERDALVFAAAAGVVVVQCSRSARGRVVWRQAFQQSNFIPGEDFSPQKARILLALALLRTSDARELRQVFGTY